MKTPTLSPEAAELFEIVPEQGVGVIVHDSIEGRIAIFLMPVDQAERLVNRGVCWLRKKAAKPIPPTKIKV